MILLIVLCFACFILDKFSIFLIFIISFSGNDTNKKIFFIIAEINIEIIFFVKSEKIGIFPLVMNK